MDFVQVDFSGGMNLFSSNDAIGANEYVESFNIRNRTGEIQPIALPVEDTTLPAGKKQGIYSFDIYSIAFVSGSAYYKNIITDSVWTKIADLILNPDVDYIYTQAVPASTIDFGRKLIDDNQILGSQQSIPLRFEILPSASSPYGLIVQDGLNTPWFILPSGVARRLQRYNEWSLTAREYVPVMKQMMYHSGSGILFGIAEDGKTMLRSVSGRPLDFVVNVTSSGDKGGDAFTTSYSIGFNTVTCLNTNTDGDILVGTEKTITVLTLNYDRTIFAEPTFAITKEYAIGIVNHFSFVKYSDSIHQLMDSDGVRTFSSQQQTDVNENRNSKFNAYIKGALILDKETIKQTRTAVVVFDDYTLFSASTTYNSSINYILVYDNTRQQWVDIDIPLGSIKMFSVANQYNNPVLFGISDSKLYKFLSGEPALADVRLKAFNSGIPSIYQKLDNIYGVFSGGTIPATISTANYVDGILNKQILQNLKGLPLETVRFNYENLSAQCWKCQPRIRWQTDASITGIQMATTNITSKTSWQQACQSQ